ncbi:MAG: hypothetical protein U9O94_08685 [Nanoarchaeota archaeon]|nr:hypothetical protein [Nanoarchaeota archaeon]
MEYQVLHVEDTELWRERYMQSITEEDIGYEGIESLSELRCYLQTNSADTYIIDGRFRHVPDGKVDFLAKDAVSMIQEKEPFADIIISSTDSNTIRWALSNGIRGFLKNQVDLIIEEIIKMREKQ